MRIRLNFSYLFLLLAQVMVGINIVGSKFLIQHYPELFLLFVRFSIAAIFLAMMHMLIPKSTNQNTQRIRDLNKRDWAFLIAQALCAGIFFNLLLLLGLHYTSASMAGVITSMLPAMIALAAIIFLRERLTMINSLCILFSVLGLLIINAHNIQADKLNSIMGDLIVLLSLVPEAAYYILAKMYHSKLPIFKVSALLNGISASTAFILLVITRSFPPLHFNFEIIAILLVVGLSAGLFFVFWMVGAKQVNGSTSGLFTALMPIATLGIARIFLGESISWVQAFGMLLVILSILANAIPRKTSIISQA